jgi:hypothetical protein
MLTRAGSLPQRVISRCAFVWPFSWAFFVLFRLTGQVKRVPVKLLTTFGAFSYSQDGWHHYTAALKEMDQEPKTNPENSILNTFYHRFSPKPGDSYLPVHDQDYWQSTKACYLPPWGGGRVVTFSNRMEQWTGPKTEDDISFHFNHLKTLCARIRSEGFRPWSYRDGYIRICVLENDNGDLRYLVVGGQHRAAIISHLGYSSVWARLQPQHSIYPGTMPNRIKFSEIDSWTEVVSGLFTHQDARGFFESYFKYDGRQQASALGLSSSNTLRAPSAAFQGTCDGTSQEGATQA